MIINDVMLAANDALMGVTALFADNISLMMQHSEYGGMRNSNGFNETITAAIENFTLPVVGVLFGAGFGAFIGAGAADSIQNRMDVSYHKRDKIRAWGAGIGALVSLGLTVWALNALDENNNGYGAVIDQKKEIKALEQISYFNKNSDILAAEKTIVNFNDQVPIHTKLVCG